MTYRLLDLFSGVGGFSLGLERSGGFKTVAFCEIEEFPRKVLRKHWPEVPIYDDVRTLTADRLAADGIGVDAICGGWPCQDISVAGKQLGVFDGSRSSLIWEVIRLVAELRPKKVILENVTALLSGSDLVTEHSVHCLCGWSCRWRGVLAPDGADEQRLRSKELFIPSVNRNGGQSKPSFADTSIKAWRGYTEAAGKNRKQFADDGLEYSHEGRLPRPDCDAAIHGSQTGTVQACDIGLLSVDDQAGWFREESSDYQMFDRGGQQAWPTEGCPDWMVCAQCGRHLGHISARYVPTTWFGGVLGALAACGYNVRWDCIPAGSIGALHQRDRIWILADAREEREQGGFPKTISRQSAFSWCENVRRLEDITGRPDLPPPLFRGTRDGIPRWMDRLGSLGNSIVPAIPELIGRAILAQEAT